MHVHMHVVHRHTTYTTHANTQTATNHFFHLCVHITELLQSLLFELEQFGQLSLKQKKYMCRILVVLGV